MQNIDFWHFIYNGSIHLSFKVYYLKYMFTLVRCEINDFINWQKLIRKKLDKYTGTPAVALFSTACFRCGLQQFYSYYILRTNWVDTYFIYVVFACCTFNCHYTSIHYIERGFPLSKNPFFQKKEKKTDIALRQHIKKMMTKSYMLMGWPPKNYFWKFCSSSCYNPLTYYAARFCT